MYAICTILHYCCQAELSRAGEESKAPRADNYTAACHTDGMVDDNSFGGGGTEAVYDGDGREQGDLYDMGDEPIVLGASMITTGALGDEYDEPAPSMMKKSNERNDYEDDIWRHECTEVPRVDYDDMNVEDKSMNVQYDVGMNVDTLPVLPPELTNTGGGG